MKKKFAVVVTDTRGGEESNKLFFKFKQTKKCGVEYSFTDNIDKCAKFKTINDALTEFMKSGLVFPTETFYDEVYSLVKEQPHFSDIHIINIGDDSVNIPILNDKITTMMTSLYSSYAQSNQISKNIKDEVNLQTIQYLTNVNTEPMIIEFNKAMDNMEKLIIGKMEKDKLNEMVKRLQNVINIIK